MSPSAGSWIRVAQLLGAQDGGKPARARARRQAASAVRASNSKNGLVLSPCERRASAVRALLSTVEG
jgi:hypothetical protein